MNLHGVVAGVIGAVNERVPVSIQVSTGSTTAADGTPQPTYAAPIPALGQVQPLTWRDLQQLDGLTLQGTRVGMYLFGEIRGIVRATNRGGDLITIASGPYTGVWLVAQVLEGWDSAGWCKTACTLQDGS